MQETPSLITADKKSEIRKQNSLRRPSGEKVGKVVTGSAGQARRAGASPSSVSEALAKSLPSVGFSFYFPFLKKRKEGSRDGGVSD